MKEEYRQPSLDMVRRTFTDHENAEEAQVVVNLIEEIRSMKTYIPELELIMVDENDEVIGYAMFSRFHIDEYGFEKAKEMGFQAVIVEGNPENYRSRGFKTSADYGIVPDEGIGLPAVECLMVKELCENALEHISGVVSYADYKSLT